MRENYQWQITEYGLETRPNNDEFFTEYAIPAKDLFEIIDLGDICIFKAMLPLLGREWVIGDDLIEIYPLALRHHSQKSNILIDEDKMSAAMIAFKANDTWLKAREIKARFASISNEA